MEILKDQIARRLREARKLSGLSQGHVAKLLNMHRPTISEIEAGNRNVSATELVEFARIYDVSVLWITGGTEESFKPGDERLQLPFRELKKLKPEDLDNLLRVLAALRDPEESI